LEDNFAFATEQVPKQSAPTETSEPDTWPASALIAIGWFSFAMGDFLTVMFAAIAFLSFSDSVRFYWYLGLSGSAFSSAIGGLALIMFGRIGVSQILMQSDLRKMCESKPYRVDPDIPGFG
jgi:hypothetical protein